MSYTKEYFDNYKSYLEILCDYVNDSIDYIKEFIDTKLPELKMKKSEETYMVWVDFRGTGMSPEENEEFDIWNDHIGVDLGSWFCQGGAGYIRFNRACPRMLVTKLLNQLQTALKEIQAKVCLL